MSKKYTVFICISFFLLMGFYSALIAFKGYTNDTNALLIYTDYMLSEGSLYTHRYEVNPPFVFLLYTPVLALHYLSDIGTQYALNLFTLFFMVISFFMALRLHATNRKSNKILSLLESEVLCWGIIFLAVLWVAPVVWSLYGDREHLLFVFGLPLISGKLMNKKMPAFYTLFALIGFLIKPFNFFIPAFFLIADMLRYKSALHVILSRDALIFLAGGLSYIFVVLYFFPDYVMQIVPLALESYAYIGVSKSVILQSLGVFALLVVSIIFLVDEDYLYALSFSAACASIFYWNGGWLYTYYVLLVPLAVFSLRVLFLSKLRNKSYEVYAYTMILVLFIWLIQYIYIYTSHALNLIARSDPRSVYYHHLPKELEDELFKYTQDKKFHLFSTNLWASDIVKRSKGTYNVSGFDVLWSLPWLVADENRYNSTYTGRHFQNDMDHAFALNPDLLIFDESPSKRKLPENFNIKTFLYKRDETFKHALQHYQKVDVLDFCHPPFNVSNCRFTIWNKNSK